MSLSQRFSLSSVLRFALSFTFAGLLTGCTLATTAPNVPIAGPALHGVTYGAGQPVIGQRVYLMAATVSGVGSAGYGVAATSLLSGTGNSDSLGSYVLSGSDGSWGFSSGSGLSATYLYTCPSASTQIYVYGVGGNPGAGTNGSESMMAALGSCGSLSSSTFIWMNELTTVAAAYSLSGFATDALHVSIPQYANATQQTNSVTDALAQTDLQNAFANAINLVNTATGVAQTTTPGGNGTPVTKQVITLGNILAACVNASDASPTNCTTLFSNALSGGSTGTTPTETATAAINIAHNPYVSATVMTNLYGLQPATGAPFAGGQTAKPTDFTVAIKFTGGGINTPYGIAIDGPGNAWTGNLGNDSVSKFASSGTAISSSSGFTGGGLSRPDGIAIDSLGNAWTANQGNASLSELSSIGTAISSSTGYKGGGVSSPQGIAIDGLGNAWVASSGSASINKFSSVGTAISPTGGYTGGGVSFPLGVAIDSSGNAWTSNQGTTSLGEFSSVGTAISPAGGYTGGGLGGPAGAAIDGLGNVWVINQSHTSVSKFSSIGTPITTSSGYTGGGLSSPSGIAIDGSGNAWVVNAGNNSVSKFSSTGSPLSPVTTGYTGGGLSAPQVIALDGSGDVWVGNSNSITELIGAATPVVTPLPVNLVAPYSAPASKP